MGALSLSSRGVLLLGLSLVPMTPIVHGAREARAVADLTRIGVRSGFADSSGNVASCTTVAVGQDELGALDEGGHR